MESWKRNITLIPLRRQIFSGSFPDMFCKITVLIIPENDDTLKFRKNF